MLEVWKPKRPNQSTLSYTLSRSEKKHVDNKKTLFSIIGEAIANYDKNNLHKELSCKNGLMSYSVLDAMIKSAENQKKIYIEY